MSAQEFSSYLALCHFLPGPSSSQLGFIIGFLRGGYLGACCAFIGFTLPSVLLLCGFAYYFIHGSIVNSEVMTALVQGLKWCAVVIVAEAIYMMFKQHCSHAGTATICAIGLLALLILPNFSPLLLLVTAFVAGLFLNFEQQIATQFSTGLTTMARGTAIVLLGVFVAITLLSLAAVVIIDQRHTLTHLFLQFFQTGAFVFGGGHAVLPMLETHTVDAGLMSSQDFTAGYGAAQLMPGPLFSFASFVGMFIGSADQTVFTVVAVTVGLFLPGLLLVLGILPFWERFVRIRQLNSGLKAVNAAVVSVLAWSFYDLILLSSITDLSGVVACCVGLALLFKYQISVLTLAFGMCATSLLLL